MSATNVRVLPAPAERRPATAFFGALAAATLLASLNTGFWASANRPLELPDGPEKVHGVAFTGFQRHQDPTERIFPTEDELTSDLALVAGFADRIRTYSAIENDAVPRLAQERGLRVTAGAWLDRRDTNNELELWALIDAARANRNVDRVIVGNETILRGDLAVPELIAYLKRVKKQLRVPVSTAEPWHVWLRHPQLARHVDFITVHLLPYWEGVPASHAVDYALGRYDELRRAFPKKRIVIGEIGWPSRGDRVGDAIASPAAQAAFVRDFLARTIDRPLDYYLMEMFDQPWKQSAEGRAGAYWGAFHADRTPKFPLAGPVEADPAWRTKALGASLLAVPFMVWFGFAFRRLRPAGRVFFCALIQGAAAALVWLGAIPLGFYLRPIDWAAFALLLPAAAAMVAVLLVNGFEFTEVLWRRAWRREFWRQPLAPGAREPFVSIHLPACNEPPEMVILTLESLAQLDYPNFEVLVIDNNTRDERLWRPVAARVEKLGSRFRFFHLPQWPGFKAGALNFALGETDPRAEAIAVVDADYAVDRGWLRNLVAHFNDANVAVIQAPQAHRDFESAAFGRMANWEFEGFFRIGMHHRNERNAIIQHGTMTLVRRHALERVGGWAEWCICEDAELGLRLIEAGHEARYVDDILGRGLTPADFKALKAQRFRWAFGAMQILRRHLRALVGRSALTAGQRYHFLTGWFSWLADALQLGFAFGAIAWTIGALAAPGVFTLPLDLYLLPVLGFLACRAFFGPVLYRARVACSWADVVGASVASMALSHAIARGVIEGLARKSGTFKRTAKGANGHSRLKWLAAVREEALMLAALALAAAGMVFRFGIDHVEAMLWTTILAAQSLPYAAALVCGWISVRGAAASVPAVAAPPAQPAMVQAAPGLRVAA
jgi:exo-beta-1,3-glucanase (GH17 family)/cellulose synthase/poly-beta-1,6-N-acetylglucosamine synthase-like glycosyltransferase